ncbi:MAG TPA: DUF2844 domain-containing protein, partial [Candidatus Sulfotelmatobacter sp.]|nr:DUF2844 domain-containing protein [Candidatus Sulfotelmatobacter sp.]
SSIQLKMLVMAALIVATAPVGAWASLGGDAASVQADQIHLQGRRTMKTAALYTVHEIQGTSGTVVREYVSPEGKVFGVAWQGPWVPDMRQLLGSYFDEYARANQARQGARIRRGPVLINEPGLVVQIVGHPRAFAGRAYVPEMLPSGVRSESIQ